MNSLRGVLFSEMPSFAQFDNCARSALPVWIALKRPAIHLSNGWQTREGRFVMGWPKGKRFSADHISKRSASYIERGKRRKKSRLIDGVECWECSTCKMWFSADHFYKDNRTPNGLKNQCKTCHTKTIINTRNPEVTRSNNLYNQRIRVARKRNAHIPYTREDLRLLSSILGHCCLICGTSEDIQLDHVVPISRGGVDHPVNMQPLCRIHNERKQARFADYRSKEQIDEIYSTWCIEFRKVEE